MSIKLRELLKLVIDRKITKERIYKAVKWRLKNSLYKIEYSVGIKTNIVKKQVIKTSDWNNLIILDACRYDFFARARANWEEPISSTTWSELLQLGE